MKTKEFRKGALLLLALIVAPAVFADSYDVDPSASSVKWLGKKVTGEHSGTIQVKEGTVEVVNGEIKGGVVVIDMNTIKNEDIADQEYNQKLVGHLKSDDFFAVESHPTATLALTNVQKTANNYTFTGDLTIKGTTKPVTFTATSSESGDVLKLNGTITIDRSKYNVRYGSSSFFDNLGDKVIYDDFVLNFNLVAKK